MSPEMLLSHARHAPSTDMWSYGCVLGDMLFNRTMLFEGANAINQLHNIARVTPILYSRLFPVFSGVRSLIIFL